MKIAQIAPLYEAIPPKLYGGTERVVANLCDSLCDLGHDVVLFAAGGARTKARLSAAREQALRLDPNPLKSEAGAHLTMSVVKPLLDDPLVEFVGEIGDADKSEFLGNAIALLFPICWPEPFGLVMIESMACGTPVIAWNSGSVPEIVDPGVTGFIVESEEQALIAVRQARELSRRRIRAIFERRFAARTMAEAYVQVYERVRQSTRESVRLAS